jgi:kynureninase
VIGEVKDLDAADTLGKYREKFLFPEGKNGKPAIYLCGNSLGLQPKTVRSQLDQELNDWARLGVKGHHHAGSPWLPYHEQFREPGARLVGAKSGEVVMMNSLTANLHLMMVSFYRPVGKRTKILIEASAFPSDTYAVKSQIRYHGLDPKEHLLIVKPREGETTIRTEDVLEIIDREGETLALTMMGGVQYFTGQVMDIPVITAAARKAGAQAGWDLAHAVGNIPLSLHDWDVDFAAWCNYKYLNSGPGAVAGCFVHERNGKDASLPRFAGWWGNDPKTRFKLHLIEDFVPHEGADGWQLSNPPILALAPLKASLALFEEAGMAALRKKSMALTNYLLKRLDEIGGGKIEVITPRDEAARGSQLSLRVKGGADAMLTKLEDEGIIADFRAPDVLRVALAPLYNNFDDARIFADTLKGCL